MPQTSRQLPQTHPGQTSQPAQDSLNQLALRVQQIQLQQEELKNQTLQMRDNQQSQPRGNMAVPYEHRDSITPQPRPQFQQQEHLATIPRYTNQDNNRYRRQEGTFRPAPRSRSTGRPATPQYAPIRRTPNQYNQHAPEDTYTDDDEVEDIQRTDNLTETELKQLPVKMPRFGMGYSIIQLT